MQLQLTLRDREAGLLSAALYAWRCTRTMRAAARRDLGLAHHVWCEHERVIQAYVRGEGYAQ